MSIAVFLFFNSILYKCSVTLKPWHSSFSLLLSSTQAPIIANLSHPHTLLKNALIRAYNAPMTPSKGSATINAPARRKTESPHSKLFATQVLVTVVSQLRSSGHFFLPFIHVLICLDVQCRPFRYPNHSIKSLDENIQRSVFFFTDTLST